MRASRSRERRAMSSSTGRRAAATRISAFANRRSSHWLKAIRSFWKYTKEREREVSLYVLLRVIDRFGDDADWKLAYKDGLKRKIKPRKLLQEIYHDLCEKGAEEKTE